MRKILFIVFTLIIFSCEDISEKIDNYSYTQYMEDGWEAFVYKEWDLGKEIFNIGLLQDSENYSEAYSGLGWIYLYEANTMPGQINEIKRDSLRNLPSFNFNLAFGEIAFATSRILYEGILGIKVSPPHINEKHFITNLTP